MYRYQGIALKIFRDGEEPIRKSNNYNSIIWVARLGLRLFVWENMLRTTIPLCIALATVSIHAQSDPPNAIFFIADDVGWNDFGCYGNEGARTPHIDKLAQNGIRFTNAYLTSSSCSPSRASIVTGRYPHNTGKAAELHLPISDHLPWLPEVLREKGYYTALSGKNHMKRVNPKDTAPFDHIDEGRVQGNRGGEANWVQLTQERPKDKPFFFWFAAYDAHRQWDADNDWRPNEYGPKISPDAVEVPPFLVDSKETRSDLASYYNEVTRFDHYIGKVVTELENQGVLNNTILFVLADNGRPFPRAKTRLHDSGMKTALVAHWPDGIRSAGVSDSLVSVIDLAPTLIEAAGLPLGPTFQGVSIDPIFKDRDATIRNYAFSEHNWHDYEALARSIRTKTHLYIVNERVAAPWQGPADSVRSPSHIDLMALRDANQLNEFQKDNFLAPRPSSELYETTRDIHQVNNLSGSIENAGIEKKLLAVLNQWRRETGDSNPRRISSDQFGRDSGTRIVEGDVFRAETPGESNQADRINDPGPR